MNIFKKITKKAPKSKLAAKELNDDVLNQITGGFAKVGCHVKSVSSLTIAG